MSESLETGLAPMLSTWVIWWDFRKTDAVDVRGPRYRYGASISAAASFLGLGPMLAHVQKVPPGRERDYGIQIDGAM